MISDPNIKNVPPTHTHTPVCFNGSERKRNGQTQINKVKTRWRERTVQTDPQSRQDAEREREDRSDRSTKSRQDGEKEEDRADGKLTFCQPRVLHLAQILK